MTLKFCIRIVFSLLGPFKLPRETEGNAYAKFWADKQQALWYVMVFSAVVNCDIISVISALSEMQ